MKTISRSTIWLSVAILFVTTSALMAQTREPPKGTANDAESTRRGKAEFRLALPQGIEGQEFKTADGKVMILGDPLGLADEIVYSRVAPVPTGGMSVEVRFSRQGQRRLLAVTSDNVGTRMAMLLDGVVHNAPVIQEAIGERAVISGDWTEEEAHQVAQAIFPATFSASMLIVSADWSAVKQADVVERELKDALKKLKVKEEHLNTLPASGPNVLFSTNLVSHYTPEHFGQLMGWMEARELIVSRSSFPAAEAMPAKEPPAGEYFMPTYRTALSKPRAFLDLPFDETVFLENDPLPFVSHDLEFIWELDYTLDGSKSAFKFDRTLGVVEKQRGQPKVQRTAVDRCSFSSKIAPQHVMVFQAFPSPDEAEFQRICRAQGIVPLIVVVPSSIDVPKADATLVLPDRVAVVSAQHGGRRNLWGPDPKDVEAVETGAWPAGESNQQTKIVSLQHVNANMARTLLGELYPDQQATVAADARTNSLVLRGEKEVIDGIVEVLQRLDTQPVAEASIRKPDNEITEADLTRLRGRYQASEGDTYATAAELRQRYSDPWQASETDKQALTKLVTQSFELRQQLHEAELIRAEQRLKKARRDIGERERIKSKIVERRVAELLRPPVRKRDGKPDSAAMSPSLFDTVESDVETREQAWKSLEGRWVLQRSKATSPFFIHVSDDKCTLSNATGVTLEGNVIMHTRQILHKRQVGAIMFSVDDDGSRQKWTGRYEFKDDAMAIRFEARGGNPADADDELRSWSGIYERTE